MQNRTYVCIDLKSYYASVECVYRNLDPLKAYLLVADESRTDKTICLAVSPALKALGVPGRPRLFEAKQKIREAESILKKKIDYIIAPPRMSAYIKQSAEIYEIFLKYISSEDIHVYSIDESFMDVTSYLHFYQGSAHKMAITMIRDVLKNTGITATAGIGTNMYLAKIAMDIIAKHSAADSDGVRIAELNEQSYREKLWHHKPLTDFWQIGSGIANRLKRYGINTMGDIAEYSLHNEEWLYKLLGINAEILIDHSWGLETCLMKDIKAYRPKNSSLSSSQVLPRPYKFNEAEIIIKEMTDLLCLDLVRKNVVAESVTLYIGFDPKSVTNGYQGDYYIDHYERIVPKPAGGTVRFTNKTNSLKEINQAFLSIFNNEKIIDRNLLIRRIALCANKISKDTGSYQLELFRDYEKEAKENNLQQTLLQIKSRYGNNAILKGMNFLEASRTRERNAQIGGHKA